MLRVAVTVALLLLFTVAARAQFTDWSTPVNLGPVINSNYLDTCVTISANGLSLFFSSNRHNSGANSRDRDLYVSRRKTLDASWEPPVPLKILNTSAWDSCPALSLDGSQLYFTSDRPGGCGLTDIWVSRRRDRSDDLGWEPPVRLACTSEGGVNSPSSELTPAFFDDGKGKVLVYFGSNRPGSTVNDIYQSEMRKDGTFGPATPVAELNSASFENGPIVRHDGLEVIFQSNRPGGSGPNAVDFWVATRASTTAPWSPPIFVPSLGNPARSGGGRIALSSDGRELYFASTRSGNLDLYVARRERLPGKKN